MKKTIILLLLALWTATASAQLEYVAGSFKHINSDAVEAGEDLGRRNMSEKLIKDWPDDFDGNRPAALIRTVFSNVADDQIRDKMQLSISGGIHVLDTKFQNTPNGLEMWTFVDPTDKRKVDLTYKQNGNLGNAYVRNVSFESGKTYQLEITNKLRLTINVSTHPTGLGVTIGGKYYGDTPITIPEMTTGEHSIVITAPADADIDLLKLPSSIRIDQNSTNFNFDLRKAHNVSFQSKDQGTLYVDDEKIGRIPGTYPLYAGAYTIRAVGDNGVTLSFAQKIDANTNVIPLVFTPSLNVSINAQYDGKQVNNAQVYITKPDGSLLRNGIQNYFDTPADVLLPYGKYKISTTYTTPSGQSVTKKDNLKVDKNTDPFFLTTLPIKTIHSNLFKRDFPRRSWGLSASYLMRWYTYKEDGRTQSCNWTGDDGKQSGVQFGIAYQPYFGYGLGLNTGFFGQYFWTDKLELSSTSSFKVEEWDLFVPLHLMFRLPIKDFDFHINTGPGFEYGVSLKGVFSGDEKGSESLDFDDGTPRAFNMYYEIGAGLRFKALQFNFVYGLGLTESKKFLQRDGTYVGAKPSKIGLTLGLMF